MSQDWCGKGEGAIGLHSFRMLPRTVIWVVWWGVFWLHFIPFGMHVGTRNQLRQCTFSAGPDLGAALGDFWLHFVARVFILDDFCFHFGRHFGRIGSGPGTLEIVDFRVPVPSLSGPFEDTFLLFLEP